MKKILIVDDEKELIALVSLHMRMTGYEVLIATNGENALVVARQEKPNLIILDLMIPKIDGWDVCKRLRQDPEIKNIPVIMLTALAETEDKLKGFEAGADDYVTKPFSPRELIARVKRVLARVEAKTAIPKRYIKGKVEIDLLEDLKVNIEGKEVVLTQKEKKILKTLLTRPGELFSRDEILDNVWGDGVVEYGNIDVHIRHLREKIEQDPDNPQIIKTVSAAGYRIEI